MARERTIDHVGRTYHRLTVIAVVAMHKQPNGSSKGRVLCRCVCGAEKEVLVCNLKNRMSPVKSCGCLQVETRLATPRTHGMGYTRTYKIWGKVVGRGTGKDQKEKYFDKGIRVSEDWRKFENFFRDMGECPPGLSIDRIDNSLGYFHGNCRWATTRTQSLNKAATWKVTYQGRTLAGYLLAEEFGIKPKTFYGRIRSGWDIDRALKTPIKKQS